MRPKNPPKGAKLKTTRTIFVLKLKESLQRNPPQNQQQRVDAKCLCCHKLILRVTLRRSDLGIPGCAWHEEVMSSRDLSSQPPVTSSWHPATSGNEPYLPSKGHDPVLSCCATTICESHRRNIEEEELALRQPWV